MFNKRFNFLFKFFKGNVFKGNFKDMQFIDRNINDVLKDLEQCEKESTLFSKQKKHTFIFRNAGNVAVFCSYPKRFFKIKPWIDSFINKHYSIKNIFVPIGKTTSKADRIRIGGTSKLAAIYSKQNVVCKTYGKIRFEFEITKKESLETEINTLKEMSKVRGINVPKVIIDNSAGNLNKTPAIWIEYINERSNWKKNKKSIAIKVQKALFRAYEHHGIEYAKFSGLFIDPVKNKEKVDLNQLINFGWTQEESSLICKALGYLSKSRIKIPKSYIHGDADVGNCLVNKNGKLIIIDWELSRYDFILYDVFNLERQGGEIISDIYESWLEQHSSKTKNILPPKIQRHLYFLRRYMNLNRIYMEWSTTEDEDTASDRLIDIRQKVITSVNKINDFFKERNLSL